MPTTNARVSLLRNGVALRPPAGSTSRLPGTWNATVSVNTEANAQGLSFDSSGNPTLTEVTEATTGSFGLGVGQSGAFTGTSADITFLSSTNPTLVAGGGTVEGSTTATSFAAGNSQTQATAEAVNVGVANVRWSSVFNRTLRVGTAATPFSASSSAAAGNLGLDASASPFPAATLVSKAEVVGFDGITPTDPSLNTPNAAAVIEGQPDATVKASAAADLSLLDPAVDASATIVANATGVRGFTVAPALDIDYADGQSATVASIGGRATSRLTLTGRTAPTTLASTSVALSGAARGITRATITTPAAGSTLIDGTALAAAQLTPASDASGATLTGLSGVGIDATTITGGGSSHTIKGLGGFYIDPSAAFGLGPSGNFDAAGISDTVILLTSGDDSIEGRIYNPSEVAAELGLDPAQVAAAGQFLDGLDASNSGFAGLRRVTAVLGTGNNSVLGSSLDSSFNAFSSDTTNSNTFSFERARNTWVLGGKGPDQLGVSSASENNRFLTSAGDDLISLTDASGVLTPGSGNVIVPGLGQDLVINGAGVNTISQARLQDALDAVSSSALAADLADPAFWANPGLDQTLLFATGVVEVDDVLIGRVDTYRNIKPGNSGDRLALNSTVTGMTDALWANGAITSIQVWDGSSWVKNEGTGALGLLVGPLSQILTRGFGAPFLAYATDTRQLMVNSDSNWTNGGATSIGTLSLTASPSALTKANFLFSEPVL